jgi:hypothetical protein
MLPLLKKKSDAAVAPAVPAWHPNFRDYEKLPDIKVVRTAFFINGLAIVVALSLALFLGFREWKLHVIKNQLAQVEAQIARDKKANDDVTAMFKKFQAEEARIKEVDTFVTSKPIVSELVLRLAHTLPENIAIDSLDLRDAGMSLRLSVRGAPDTAPTLATAYQEQLRADKELSVYFEDVAFVTTPTLNPGTGRMAVEFMLRAKGGAKK